MTVLNFPQALPPKVIDIINIGIALAVEEVATSRRDTETMRQMTATEYWLFREVHGDEHPLWRPWI